MPYLHFWLCLYLLPASSWPLSPRLLPSRPPPHRSSLRFYALSLSLVAPHLISLLLNPFYAHAVRPEASLPSRLHRALHSRSAHTSFLHWLLHWLLNLPPPCQCSTPRGLPTITAAQSSPSFAKRSHILPPFLPACLASLANCSSHSFLAPSMHAVRPEASPPSQLHRAPRRLPSAHTSHPPPHPQTSPL